MEDLFMIEKDYMLLSDMIWEKNYFQNNTRKKNGFWMITPIDKTKLEVYLQSLSIFPDVNDLSRTFFISIKVVFMVDIKKPLMWFKKDFYNNSLNNTFLPQRNKPRVVLSIAFVFLYFDWSGDYHNRLWLVELFCG